MSHITPLMLIGYGDIAARVAARQPERDITAIARRTAAHPADHRAHWQSLALDLDSDALPAPATAAIWLYFAPPSAQGIEDHRVSRWLRAASHGARPTQVIYASTTAVYGDVAGAWVDERAPLAPQHDRGRRRRDAEQQWQAWCDHQGVPLTILRITGIYACDRLPLDKIRAGTPIVCPDQAPWSNRIHADDLADLCSRLIDRCAAGSPVVGVFNVSDNHPLPMSALYQRTAEHFGLPLPPCLPLAEVLATASPMAREFLSESKRINATAIQHALNWRPRYPNIDATLADCAAAYSHPTIPR